MSSIIKSPGNPNAHKPDVKRDFNLWKCGFEAGAEWMLEKALDWIGDNVVSNKFGESINTEDFIKAMKKE